MFTISTKYSKSFDYIAFLCNDKSNLKNITSIIDFDISKKLTKKASKNKRKFTFISTLDGLKFKNYFFYNVDLNKNEFYYQNIGGKIINEAISLKKKKIELVIDFLQKNLLNKFSIENILIGILSRSYVFNNYKF